MAVIDGMPSTDIIRICQGTVDIYVWRGIRVARAWPRKSGYPRTPAQLAQQASFTQAVRAVQQMDGSQLTQATQEAAGTAYTWRDVAMKAATGKLITW